MNPGYQTSTGETAAPGIRANAFLVPFNSLRTTGSAMNSTERVPSGTGRVDTATQGSVAFSLSVKTADTSKHHGSEYPLVTQALDSLPLVMPNGMPLPDAASVIGTFGASYRSGDELVSIRVGDQATMFVDTPATVGQTLRAVFPTTATDLARLPIAENGCRVPRVEAVDPVSRGESVLATLGRVASASMTSPAAAAAVSQLKTGLMQFAYVMAARALVAAENPTITGVEEADRLLASTAFTNSESGRALSVLAAAFGVVGRSTEGVNRIVDMTFKEMCNSTRPLVSSNVAIAEAIEMAMRRITQATSFLHEYDGRHVIGTCLTNVTPRAGERGKVDVLLRTH